MRRCTSPDRISGSPSSPSPPLSADASRQRTASSDHSTIGRGNWARKTTRLAKQPWRGDGSSPPATAPSAGWLRLSAVDLRSRTRAVLLYCAGTSERSTLRAAVRGVATASPGVAAEERPAMTFTPDFSADEDFARHLDAADPLARFRDRFLLPAPARRHAADLPLRPLARPAAEGGARPRRQELDDWAALGVEGHFRGDAPWYTYHEAAPRAARPPGRRRPGEVVFMNGLTVNLHLMLATFYRPDAPSATAS